MYACMHVCMYASSIKCMCLQMYVCAIHKYAHTKAHKNIRTSVWGGKGVCVRERVRERSREREERRIERERERERDGQINRERVIYIYIEIERERERER